MVEFECSQYDEKALIFSFVLLVIGRNRPGILFAAQVEKEDEEFTKNEIRKSVFIVKLEIASILVCAYFRAVRTF